MTKYYAETGSLRLPMLKNFPNHFPMFIMASEAELRKLNATMVKASQYGFSMSKRKVCFTLGCQEGMTHEELFNKLKTLPEISKEKYEFLLEIPHWNPIKEATHILESFIEMMEESRRLGEEMELPKVISDAFEKAQEKNEIRMNVR